MLGVELPNPTNGYPLGRLGPKMITQGIMGVAFGPCGA